MKPARLRPTACRARSRCSTIWCSRSAPRRCDVEGAGMSSPLKVFITGASSGIGLALAAEYARRGAILGLVARRGDALTAFQQSHPQNSISTYSVDVRDAEALAEAAAQFITQHGLPDVVIANAGISRGAVTGHGDLRTFREVMDINY